MVQLQVLEQYEGGTTAGGLSRQSLAQLYREVGDCDLDFHTLGLAEAEPQRVCKVLLALCLLAACALAPVTTYVTAGLDTTWSRLSASITNMCTILGSV